MTRVSFFVTAAFLAGLGLGLHVAGSSSAPQKDLRAANLAAIEKLHKGDIQATLKQDLSALNSTLRCA